MLGFIEKARVSKGTCQGLVEGMATYQEPEQKYLVNLNLIPLTTGLSRFPVVISKIVIETFLS